MNLMKPVCLCMISKWLTSFWFALTYLITNDGPSTGGFSVTWALWHFNTTWSNMNKYKLKENYSHQLKSISVTFKLVVNFNTTRWKTKQFSLVVMFWQFVCWSHQVTLTWTSSIMTDISVKCHWWSLIYVHFKYLSGNLQHTQWKATANIINKPKRNPTPRMPSYILQKS